MAQIQLTSIPIVMIIVCVVLGLNLLSGAVRGFVRKISGIVAFFLAVLLVTSLLPVVTAWLHTTPVYGFIRQQCESISGNLAKNAVSGALASGGSDLSGITGSGGAALSGAGGSDPSAVIDAVRADDGSGALDRSKIKARLQDLGYDPSIVDSMSDSELEGYAQQFIGAGAGLISPARVPYCCLSQVPLFEIQPAFTLTMLEMEGAYAEGAQQPASDTGTGLLSKLAAGMDRADQTRFIESLPLPQSVKDQMETFNNEKGYLKLGASDFSSYIINYIASLIMNILAYAVTLLVVWLIIRLVLGALSVFRSLPIVGAADHLLGLLLGLIQGVLIIWGLFLALSLFSATDIGSALMREINGSPFLSLLYNTNPFLNSAAGAIKGIM